MTLVVPIRDGAVVHRERVAIAAALVPENADSLGVREAHHGPVPGVGVVAAAAEFPAVNGRIEGDEIVYNRYVHIGMAVSAPSGLMVPVIRHCEEKSFAQIESELAELAGKARDGKLREDDMSGGTFTISNGGVFGSLLSTPILNRPQSGILGLHKIQQRPMAVDGEVKIRPMMYLALSYDHRLIDGREAVTFLVKVKQGIEDPQSLMLDV